MQQERQSALQSLFLGRCVPVAHSGQRSPRRGPLFWRLCELILEAGGSLHEPLLIPVHLRTHPTTNVDYRCELACLLSVTVGGLSGFAVCVMYPGTPHCTSFWICEPHKPATTQKTRRLAKLLSECHPTRLRRLMLMLCVHATGC